MLDSDEDPRYNNYKYIYLKKKTENIPIKRAAATVHEMADTMTA